jgi:hypothetical protein
MMGTKPRVKGADNTHGVTAQKGVITRHFHKWHNTNVTAGQDEMIACHLHPNGGVWSDQSNQRKEPKKCPNSGTRSIKRAFSHIKTTLQVLLAYPDYFYSL